MKKGFTQIELLVALIVLAILAGGAWVWQNNKTPSSTATPVQISPSVSVNPTLSVPLTTTGYEIMTAYKIAFVKEKDIWVSDADGTKSSKVVDHLTGFSDNNIGNLRFSPSGEYLIWSKSFLEGQDSRGDYYSYYILKMNLSSGNIQKLAKGEFQDVHPTEDKLLLFNDSIKGAYLSELQIENGHESTILKERPKTDDGTFFSTAHYSPDGKKILLGQMFGNNNADVVIIDTTGNIIKRFPNLIGYPGDIPTWLPNSDGFIFRDGEGKLMIQYLGQSTPRVLLESDIKKFDTSSRIAINKNKLAFLMAPSANDKPDLYTLNQDGSNLKLLLSSKEITKVNPSASIIDIVQDFLTDNFYLTTLYLADLGEKTSAAEAERKDFYVLKGANLKKIAENVAGQLTILNR